MEDGSREIYLLAARRFQKGARNEETDVKDL